MEALLQDRFQAKILVAGAPVEVPAFVLTAPISFWGGVDPQTGLIANVRHPQYGQSVSGKALCLPATVGSSSAAAVLLELVHSNRAPAAIFLHEPDAILLLGLIVAEEMGLKIPPAYQLDRETYALLDQRQLHISEQGTVRIL
ncbi:aconitase X swivel domain-containing protein [Pseudochrobactrum asaccharolyticum]|uniref:aconitase X swivel domain-containing protein n=1 Tax=Pseudochrobactrum asaccharolyticum TaxID=354351 RepID=UPI0040431C36